MLVVLVSLCESTIGIWLCITLSPVVSFRWPTNWEVSQYLLPHTCLFRYVATSLTLKGLPLQCVPYLDLWLVSLPVTIWKQPMTEWVTMWPSENSPWLHDHAAKLLVTLWPWQKSVVTVTFCRLRRNAVSLTVTTPACTVGGITILVTALSTVAVGVTTPRYWHRE